MRRFLIVSLLVVSAAGAGQAQAKGLVALSVCGTNGCHSTRDAGELAHAMDSVAQANPGQQGPFLELRAAIGEPGHRRAFARVRSLWMPSLNVIRGDEGPMAGYTMPDPALRSVLQRLARGLRTFPAAKLPPEPGQPQNARVADVVPAPPADHGGDGGSGRAWWLLALLPAGLVFALRRRGRWI